MTLPSGAAAEGPNGGGTTITITGSFFTGTTAVALVPDAVGSDLPAASFTVTSDSTITAVTPLRVGANRAKYYIQVVTPGGTTVSTGAAAFYYNFY